VVLATPNDYFLNAFNCQANHVGVPLEKKTAKILPPRPSSA
jgi:hypothetical protein